MLILRIVYNFTCNFCYKYLYTTKTKTNMMTVNFKFICTLNLHNKTSYINYIERDGIDEETAYNRSTVQLDKSDIKSVDKTKDGYATITRKSTRIPLVTIESYNEILEVLHNTDIAMSIMNQEKLYIFDDFEVSSDELKVSEGWSEIKK